jgi:hypothetical protein
MSTKWSKGIRAKTFDDGAFIIYGGDGAVLCQRPAWPHRIEESRANGVLLGAAAELYEALKLVEWYPPRFKCVDCGGQPSTGHAATCHVGAALTKATTP